MEKASGSAAPVTGSTTPLAIPVVTVRYWASARAAAGRSEDLVSGRTVGDVLAAVRLVHARNPRLLQVLAVSSLLLGDVPVGGRDLTGVMVDDGDSLEVLPPFAGG